MLPQVHSLDGKQCGICCFARPRYLWEYLKYCYPSIDTEKTMIEVADFFGAYFRCVTFADGTGILPYGGLVIGIHTTSIRGNLLW